jgi:hypothetical protein
MSEQERTIFVGGISQKADEQSLRLFFESFGTVTDCKIIYDRTTGKSKGYGFVTFQDLSAAEKAKASTNLFFLGKTMNVGPAQKKTQSTVQQPRTTTTVAAPQTVAVPFIQQPYGYPQAMMYNPYPMSMAYQPAATTAQQTTRPGALPQGFATQGLSGSGVFQTQPLYQGQAATYQPQLYPAQALTTQTGQQLQGLAASYFVPTTTQFPQGYATSVPPQPTQNVAQPQSQSQAPPQPLATTLSSASTSSQSQSQQPPSQPTTSTTASQLQAQPSQPQSAQSNNFAAGLYQPTQQQQNYASAYYAYAQYHTQPQVTQSSHQ